MSEIKQGGIYTYDTREWGRVKVIACEREYQSPTIWRCFRLDTPFGDSRHWSIVASSLQPWIDEPPKPKLITWYRPKGYRYNASNPWETPRFWYRSALAANLALADYELFGMETMEAPE